MRYLVKAQLKEGKAEPLRRALSEGRLGRGSVAEGEYDRNMKEARLLDDGTVEWVEVCYCATPLEEERPYWEAYFKLESVKDAHARRNCRHENGTEPWACSECDCTRKLEESMARRGKRFLDRLHSADAASGTEK